LLNIKINRPKLVNTWDITGNILAKFHGNILNLTENIAVFFWGGVLFWLTQPAHSQSDTRTDSSKNNTTYIPYSCHWTCTTSCK